MAQDPMLDTLVAMYKEPRSVSSDFARYNAQTIGALASRGFITTRQPHERDSYGRLWRITAAGLTHLEEAIRHDQSAT